MRLPLAAVATAVSVWAPEAAFGQGAAGRPQLAFPLACEIGRTCEVQHYVDRDPGPGILDYRCGRRTNPGHSGVDIRLLDMAQQRQGVEVLAAAPGRVARLRDGMPDVSIRAPGAPSVAGRECGDAIVIDHGGGWETQYCHLARGSLRVKVGDMVAAGQPIARVGLSGDTEFPHLHLTVRHAGQIVDPFAPEAGVGCTPQRPMWSAGALRQLGYKAGAILNAGFASGPVSMADVEAGGAPAASAQAPMLLAYVRAIELEAGDEIELSLSGPDGSMLAKGRLKPLAKDQAQYLATIGRKRPAAGWPPGRYTADVRVYRSGKVALQRRFTTAL